MINSAGVSRLFHFYKDSPRIRTLGKMLHRGTGTISCASPKEAMGKVLHFYTNKTQAQEAYM